MMNKQANIRWQDGQPFSQQFDDIYFSADSGLAETQHVFLQHNQLEQRWKSLSEKHFTIAETGFGTGLNFLCAWDLWNKLASSDAKLHFVSCEKYPLKPEDLETALKFWPSLNGLSKELLKQYRYLSEGMHRLIFEQGRVVLTLMVGDALTTLSQLHANVDAWFLDGFAPSKNPEMWQPALFAQMTRLSNAETTFSTFTSAGLVRRGLTEAGFKVSKVGGFGSKREMLCGQYIGPQYIGLGKSANEGQRKAIIIGAGIAGCSTSYALATRGWQVTLIERHSKAAEEASGNPVAVLYPRLAMQQTLMSQISLAGFLYTNRLIKHLALNADAAHQCGLLQLAFDAREAERCNAVAKQALPADAVRKVGAKEASEIAGIKIINDALHFPDAGWVKPKVFCEALLAHPNIKSKFNKHALHIEKSGGLWQVWEGKTLLDEAPVLIITSANETLSFSQTAHLPLQAVRGQISVAQANTESRQLRTVICTNGYISPAIEDQHCIGATFSPDDTLLDIREEDHAENMAMLNAISPVLADCFEGMALQGRASLRAATPDYLPLVGMVIDQDELIKHPPKHYDKPPQLPYLQGLFVNTGHGSKGITQAPLCAEMLASAICGEPLPIANNIVAALDPNRFLLRKLGLKNFIKGLTGTAIK
jgi:tRNA 5-methylaminomethyl-2-thiouridine biosynthesis bifunctional protein